MTTGIYKQYLMKDPPLLEIKIPAGNTGWQKPYIVIYRDSDGIIKRGMAWSRTLAFVHYQDLYIHIPAYPGARQPLESGRTILYMFKVSLTNLCKHYQKYPK